MHNAAVRVLMHMCAQNPVPWNQWTSHRGTVRTVRTDHRKRGNHGEQDNEHRPGG